MSSVQVTIRKAFTDLRVIHCRFGNHADGLNSGVPIVESSGGLVVPTANYNFVGRSVEPHLPLLFE